MSQLSIFPSDPYGSAIQAINEALPEDSELAARITGLLIDASRLQDELSEERTLRLQLTHRLLDYHDREQSQKKIFCHYCRSTGRAIVIPFRKEGCHA